MVSFDVSTLLSGDNLRSMAEERVSAELRRFILSRAEYHADLGRRWSRLYETLVREDRLATFHADEDARLCHTRSGGFCDQSN